MTNDPLERIIAMALDEAGIAYTTDVGGGNPSGLDFKLSDGIEIEVKRFHSPRIADQMSRAENVIAVQGEYAVQFLAHLIRTAPENEVKAAYLDGLEDGANDADHTEYTDTQKEWLWLKSETRETRDHWIAFKEGQTR